MAMRTTRRARNPKSPKAAKQAKPVIAVAGVSPATGDAPSKGVGETSRSEWRLGVCHFSAHARERATASRQRAMRARRAGSGSWGSKRRSTAHCAAMAAPPAHTPVAKPAR